MSNLFGGQPKIIPEFTGLQVNTAVQVLPIPIIYGSPRISVNLIYYNGFWSYKIKSGGKGTLSGGKGGGSIGYKATLLMAIGEGPLGDTKIIYQDQNVFVPFDYPTNGAYYFPGTRAQAPWGIFSYYWTGDARGYTDTAYYAFLNADLSSSATVPQIDLVVSGQFTGSSPLNDDTIVISTGQYDTNGMPVSYIGPIPMGTCDADPAQVIWDFLTHDRYGAGFPAGWIDGDYLFSTHDAYKAGVGDKALSTYCQAVGLAWSVVINNVESASSILERWLKNLSVAAVWTGETLRFIPFWDNDAGANPGLSAGAKPKYYRGPANNSGRLDIKITITMDHILQSTSKDEDPINFMRKDPTEVYNTVRVDFRDRHNFFNDVPAEAKDEAHIELYGPRVDNIGLANEFSLGTYAIQSAVMQLRRNVGVMRTYTWRMGPIWAWLLPMDLVRIPDPTNYANTVEVRIISIEDDEDENMTITAEEFSGGIVTYSIDVGRRGRISTSVGRSGGLGDPSLPMISSSGQSPTSFPMPPTTPPHQGAINSPPQPAYPPVIFEPTPEMQVAMGYGTPIFVVGVSGGVDGTLDQNWGGANIHISLDDVGYEQIGQIISPSTIGYITSPLPAFSGANPDNTNSVTVSLGQCNSVVRQMGFLDMSSDSAASSGHSICVIQDNSGYEVLAYVSAILTAPYTYVLTGLYRGFYGTSPRRFNAGAKFLYVGTNANILVGNLPVEYVGKNFWIKPQSFSMFHNIVEDLSEVLSYEYFVGGPGVSTSLIVSDAVSSSDVFALSGQRFATLHDSIVASDDNNTGTSVAYFGNIDDTVLASDHVSP